MMKGIIIIRREVGHRYLLFIKSPHLPMICILGKLEQNQGYLHNKILRFFTILWSSKIFSSVGEKEVALYLAFPALCTHLRGAIMAYVCLIRRKRPVCLSLVNPGDLQVYDFFQTLSLKHFLSVPHGVFQELSAYIWTSVWLGSCGWVLECFHLLLVHRYM